MKLKVILPLSIIIVAAILIWTYIFETDTPDEIIIKPTLGQFKITVTTTGELKAKNSVDIRGPSSVQSVGIYQMKISNIIPEGSLVKKGDFVAELDKTDILGRIKESEISVQKLESQLLQSKLDSNLNLSAARDELENLKFNMEEKKLLKEQSKFEPPAIIRQAEIDYEKVKRSFDQAKKNYTTKVKKAVTSLSIIGADLSKEQQKLSLIMKVFDQFTIKAPADGMVIYAREWNGRRKIAGSTINSWNPVVAKLPDLTKMESLTYVNEVDIQKIKKDQKVNISLDADPEKKLEGKIINVANIGEQRQNSDSKVFEVLVEVIGTDTTLRPAMTTSNEIIVKTIDNVLFIPLECIHTENEISYVYLKDNGSFIKQQVVLGLMNENEAIIEKGIKENSEIALSVPSDLNNLEISFLEGKDK